MKKGGMKETKAKKLIELNGSAFGVNYDKKTFKNIEKILICHQSYTQNRDTFNHGVLGKTSMEKLIPFVFGHFISNEEINGNIINPGH